MKKDWTDIVARMAFPFLFGAALWLASVALSAFLTWGAVDWDAARLVFIMGFIIGSWVVATD